MFRNKDIFLILLILVTGFTYLVQVENTFSQGWVGGGNDTWSYNYTYEEGGEVKTGVVIATATTQQACEETAHNSIQNCKENGARCNTQCGEEGSYTNCTTTATQCSPGDSGNSNEDDLDDDDLGIQPGVGGGGSDSIQYSYQWRRAGTAWGNDRGIFTNRFNTVESCREHRDRCSDGTADCNQGGQPRCSGRFTTGVTCNPVSSCTVHGTGGIAVGVNLTTFTPFQPLDQFGLYAAEDDEVTGLPTFVNRLLLFVISISTLLSILMIVYGGVKYVTAVAVQDKGEGKKIITNALVGLTLVLTSVLILQTINPRLLSLDPIRPINISLDPAGIGWTPSPGGSNPVTPGTPPLNPGVGPSAPPDTLAYLGNQILQNPKIEFNTLSNRPLVPNPINESEMIPESERAMILTSMGQSAPFTSNCTNVPTNLGTSTYLHHNLLTIIIQIAEEHTVSYGSFQNFCHGNNSRHYLGRAADINFVNGKAIKDLTDLEYSSFIISILGFFPDGSQLVLHTNEQRRGVPTGWITTQSGTNVQVSADGNHQRHIHISIPRN